MSHFHADGGQCFSVGRALVFTAAVDVDGLRAPRGDTSYRGEEPPPPARRGNLFLGVMFESDTLNVF